MIVIFFFLFFSIEVIFFCVLKLNVLIIWYFSGIGFKSGFKMLKIVLILSVFFKFVIFFMVGWYSGVNKNVKFSFLSFFKILFFLVWILILSFFKILVDFELFVMFLLLCFVIFMLK